MKSFRPYNFDDKPGVIGMNEVRRSGYRRDRNAMSIPDRIGEIVGIFFILLFAAFFVYHQTMNTGFMTSDFGLTATLLFYGSFAAAIMSPVARAIIGRRDTSRPFEIAANLFTAIAAFWFLSAFPFNFAHLADPLPSFMRFLFTWISNEIGWAIILLTAIVSLGVAIGNTVKMVLDWI